MPIPFVDLKSQYLAHKGAIDRAVLKVFDHCQYVMGPEIDELEQRLAEYVGVEHTVSCGNGTQALLLPLMTRKLRRNDAVFVPTYTFFATAETVSLTGGTPVFVDVDPGTFNIDPGALREAIESTLKRGELQPRGIIPVDLFGLPADYDAIHTIAREFDLFVLEDAAQAFGARYRSRRTCSLAEVAAVSFFPAKPLGCYGDGGAVFTSDAELAEELRSLRVHGQNNHRYDNVRIGLNARMDTVQAAVLLQKLDFFDDELERRRQLATRYRDRLDQRFQTQQIPDGYDASWAVFSLLSDRRDAVRERLSENGIPSAIYYPTPLHLTEAYRHLGHEEGDYPVAESLSARMLSLPIHPYLTFEQVDGICEIVNSVN